METNTPKEKKCEHKNQDTTNHCMDCGALILITTTETYQPVRISHQPEELKGNKFTWSEEKKKELEKICDNLNKRDSMEERYNKFLNKQVNLTPREIELFKDFFLAEKALSRAEGREEVLNATGFLRQWLNERTDTKLITDEDIRSFLEIGVK